MTFELQWTAAVGTDPTHIPTAGDPLAANVLNLHGEVKSVANSALTALSQIKSREDLSDLGKEQARTETATKAISLIRDRTSMTAARAELSARHAACPVPGIEVIPGVLAQPLLTALGSVDPLQRESMALQWLSEGDAAPATLLVHASGPLRLVDNAAKARLSEALRTAGNSRAAQQARQLSQALEATDGAAQGAIQLIMKAAGIKTRDVVEAAARGQ